jgi:hypothetical protein
MINSQKNIKKLTPEETRNLETINLGKNLNISKLISSQGNTNIMIINFNEDNQKYTDKIANNYFTHKSIDTKKLPPFIVVSTQNSTTKKKNGESLSFQHVMKKKLQQLDYSYKFDNKNIKNDARKSLFNIGSGVLRLRLYKKQDSRYKNVDIFPIDFSFRKVLCLTLEFELNKNLTNSSVSESKNNNLGKQLSKNVFLNIGSDIFYKESTQVTYNPDSNNFGKSYKYYSNIIELFGKKIKSAGNRNLIDLFYEGYSIYFFVEGKIYKYQKSDDLKSINTRFHNILINDIIDMIVKKYVGNNEIYKNKMLICLINFLQTIGKQNDKNVIMV